MIPLADLTTSPNAEGLGTWMQGLGWLVGVCASACAVALASRKAEGIAQPLRVKGEYEFVTRPEFQEQITEIYTRMNELDSTASHRVVEFERMMAAEFNKLSSDMATLRERSTTTAHEVTLMRQDSQKQTTEIVRALTELNRKP